MNTKVCGLEEEAGMLVSCCGCVLSDLSLGETHTLRPYLYLHSQSLQFLASLELERGLLEQQRERESQRSMASTKRHSSLWTEHFRS